MLLVSYDPTMYIPQAAYKHSGLLVTSPEHHHLSWRDGGIYSAITICRGEMVGYTVRFIIDYADFEGKTKHAQRTKRVD
jgi:hypothetical protein